MKRGVTLFRHTCLIRYGECRSVFLKFRLSIGLLLGKYNRPKLVPLRLNQYFGGVFFEKHVSKIYFTMFD